MRYLNALRFFGLLKLSLPLYWEIQCLGRSVLLLGHCFKIFKAALSNLLAAVQRFPNAGDLNAVHVATCFPMARGISSWRSWTKTSTSVLWRPSEGRGCDTAHMTDIYIHIYIYVCVCEIDMTFF